MKIRRGDTKFCLKKYVDAKILSPGFYVVTLPLPSVMTRWFIGKFFESSKMTIIFANNTRDTMFQTIRYCHIIVIFSVIRHEISRIFKQRVSSIFWSYKDTLVVLCELDKIVFRISGPRSSSLNKKNFSSLKSFLALGLAMFPSPISRRLFGKVIISCEEYVGDDITSAISTSNCIFEGLFPLYQKTYEVISGDDYLLDLLSDYENLVPVNKRAAFKKICHSKIRQVENISKNINIYTTGIIHGDLTPRNIASYSSDLAYFDLDRSEKSFPEFDLFMMVIDRETIASGDRSYKRSLAIANELVDNPSIRKALDLFYDDLPVYSNNRQYFELICNLFFVRAVAYIFSDAGFDETINTSNLT